MSKKIPLLVTHLYLVSEWHPTKNGVLNPQKLTAGSHKKVWWKCENNHEWQTAVKERNKGRGCPFCTNRMACKDNSLAFRNPNLAAEWHPTKNGDLTPESVLLNSGKKVWWKCEKNHEWQTAVKERNKGRGFGCRICSNNNKSKKND